MVGAQCYILPFIEQANIYNTFTEADKNFWSISPIGVQPANVWWGYNFTSPNGYWANIKTYLCPSDIAEYAQPVGGVWLCYISFTYGGTYYLGGEYMPGNLAYGRNNYASNAGWLGNYTGNAATSYAIGPYYDNSRTKITDIVDGTSNTLGFGETLAGAQPPNQRDFVASWTGALCVPTAWALGYPAEWYMFSSLHPTVVNFAMCDGSVHGVFRSITSTFLAYTSGMNEGQYFPANEYFNP
jgi:prepilin-type processing-associated H-X9-DG protein